MGQTRLHRPRALRASLAAFAASLLFLLLAPQAFAVGGPFHARNHSLDITGSDHACGTATDSKGDLYLSSAGDNAIDVYDPAHTLLTSIEDTHEPCGLAVTTTGNLFVSEQATGEVVRFKPNAYPFAGTPTYGEREVIDASGDARGIAIDRYDNRLYVAEGTRVSTIDTNNIGELQILNVDNATGGTYKLRFEDEETASLAFDASNAEIQAELSGLAAIGAGGVSVSTFQGTVKRILFSGQLVSVDVPQIEAIGSLTGSETQTVIVSATAGTYKLRFEGEETAPIGFEASPGALQTALEALPAIGAGNVAVTGGPGDELGTKPYFVAFQGSLAAKDVGQIEGEAAALGGVLSLGTGSDGAGILTSTSRSGGLGTDEVQSLSLQNARGGTYKLKFENEETAAIAYNAPARKGEGAGSVEAALEGLGEIGAGNVSVVKSNAGTFASRAFKVSFEGAKRAEDVPQLELVSSLTGNETQRVVVNATTGTYKLEQITARGLGDTTTGSKVLTGVSASLGAFHVGDAIGGPGIPSGTTIAAVGVGTLELSAAAFETRNGVLLTATETTAAIPYSASETEVQTALEALPAIGAGNVAVTGGPGDEKGAKPYLVTFQGSLAAKDVEQMKSDASGLAGGTVGVTTTVGGLRAAVSTATAGGAGGIGEGALSEATGVAPYTYRTSESKVDRYLWVADAATDSLYLFGGEDEKPLKQRRELSGDSTPDGSFDFGSAGAYLAADPGNREAAGDKCIAVGEQACTAGHLFLYDAENHALDEFDASGEYLGQTTNEAFADAGPTAIAIDRSGGANDGTIYVTAGASAGAQALAFGPLKAPSRAELGEPLSHVLKAKPKAIATDSHGDVYVAEGTQIHVYKPDGSGLGKIVINGKGEEEEKGLIEDSHKPFGLAVDSTGIVYVLDENNTFSSTFEATYYTPNIGGYPPTAATTYTRRASALALPGDFNGGGLSAIAVNPGPGPGKDHLFVATGGIIHEYDSAAHGSELLNGDFARGPVNPYNVGSLAVDGRSGNVYAASFGLPFRVVNAAGTEGLARINEAGGPVATSPYLTPHLAVDQSNGHVVEYDGKTSTAREYDASGGFVAEFGQFSENLFEPYRVAVDNACALHEPPLDETTEPTCHQYDPSDGTVYVAFNDTKLSHPPYDVTAFGPLDYGAAPVEPKEFKLTVKTEGTGTGTVTGIGIDCPGDCTEVYEDGTKVPLTQEAIAGSKFTGWSGACSGAGPCEVTMSEAKSVTATFEEEEAPEPGLPLTVALEGTGSGTVTSDTGLISCNPFCEDEYEAGTEVTLTASPAAGSLFMAWRHCDSGGIEGRQCTVTMDKAKQVSALFATAHELTVSKAEGSGPGKVQAYGGLTCLYACTQTTSLIKEGAAVVVKQTPAKHFHFAGWSGDCAGAGACELTMGEDHEVSADFEEDPRFTLTLSKAGGGQGTVKSQPAGISCGLTCSTSTASFYDKEAVELTATAGKGSAFEGWSVQGEPSACTGTGPCKLTIDQVKGVKATFE